jgi:hypothetical protein
MKTYQDIEKQASESKIEFDSIIWQIDERWRHKSKRCRKVLYL